MNRALALQRDPSLPPSLELDPGACPILRPGDSMKERLERHCAPLPVCPGGDCPVRAFLDGAAACGASLEIDVGAGYGRFSRGHAAANPGTLLLGIEQDSARVARTDVAARLAGIGNVRYLVAEVRYSLEWCIRPGTVSSVFVLFPDPWPKDRHARHRFFRPRNIELVRRALRVGGFLHAATDNAAYFAQMLEVLAADDGFERIEPYVRTPEEQTDFELKFLGQGKKANLASWRKIR